MKTILLGIIGIAFTGSLMAQKKTIDHTAYTEWNRLSENQISQTGKYITYEINPLKGDGYLYVYNTGSGQLDSFFRARNAQIALDESYMVFDIKPGYDTLRNCELKKVDKKKWPKDTLAVYVFGQDSLIKITSIKAHSIGKKNSWLMYQEEGNELQTKATPDKKKKKKKKKKEEEAEVKSDGTILRIWHPVHGEEKVFQNVTAYELSDDGKHLAYITNENEEYLLHDYATASGEIVDSKLPSRSIKGMTWNEDASALAYLSSPDTTKTKTYALYSYRTDLRGEQLLVDTSDLKLPAGMAVSENRGVSFSKDGRFLFFGVAERPITEPEDTLLESEKPKLDIWHYLDGRLQPQQLKQLKRDQTRTDLYAYVFQDHSAVALSDDTLEVRLSNHHEGEYLLGTVSSPYEVAYQWDMSGKEDVYRIHILTGKKELIKKEVRSAMPLPQSGDRLVYFDFDTHNYKSRLISTGVEQCLTCTTTNVKWVEDINGMPMDAEPVGTFGWSRDGQKAYLRSRNDLYVYDFASNALSSVTEEMGKNNKVQYTPFKWNQDSAWVNLSNLYFLGYDEQTKGTHLLEMSNGKVGHVAYWEATVGQLSKAPTGNVVTMRQQTVSHYPELEVTDTTFAEFKTISVTNPQQAEYNWATAELIKWKSYSGLELEGLVYKPEDFDPKKEYPLLVYYYELYSDKLHTHYTPRPTASIIYPTEYASAGYIVFIPDIRYQPGHPAKSAYDCIMSGTDAVLNAYPNIDSTRMGLQGQSWGGYQTAQLVTMTKRYAAAMAGAPVSNMFSAYGGIRWGSGINRQFQYEKTQSRIGKTIWEAPDLYIENSPLFHLPNVSTPLLIMHNDGDGAVPWYQGIELYTGMRRLGKPCWLLNYNDDDHNLMKDANRMDLSIRMRQFFDHYLLGKPAPLWLTQGIPAVKKGEELRYELDKD